MQRILCVLMLTCFVYGSALPREKETSERKAEFTSKGLGAVSFEETNNKATRPKTKFSNIKLWPKPESSSFVVVPYYIHGSVATAAYGKIVDVFNAWNKKVSFIKWKSVDRELEFVNITMGESCTTPLGKQGGSQRMQLTDGCLDGSGILRLALHTVGLEFEEHNRFDRIDYIEVIWDNIEEKYWEKFEMHKPDEYEDMVEYDYFTCMHIPKTAFAYGQNDSFIVLKDGINIDDVGRSQTPTEGDVKKLKILYAVKT